MTIPRKTDQLLLTVDASPVNKGLGGTLFLNRDGERHIAQFFSFKLKDYQVNWFPCELEALAIATGVENFSAYIRESIHPLKVLTDSKPCVQANSRLCKGQFSASARVSNFLSTLSSYNVSVQHISSRDNVSSDFGSRNPQPGCEDSCQICKFVYETIDSVVRTISAQDIVSGSTPLPYLNRSAWRLAQQDCPDLRRAFVHLKAGTRPSRKARNLKHLRRYLNAATLDQTGLIIVNKEDPFTSNRSLIVVPHKLLPGIVTAIHLHTNHCSKHQLKLIFNRHFYGINSDSIINVVDYCSQCNALKVVPREVFDQSALLSAKSPGEVFFTDVLRRNRQKICVTRDVTLRLPQPCSSKTRQPRLYEKHC